ncbi:hypothetical protein PHMEG_00036174 [Phytophthora megakarya]|uniref:Uncharacterized protein n=1 Tax=Phytophthora megakarya TaxID=4795 RepID=A0A225UM46_9STRA|nr:hypothetical protein PHMEG_00036174 [Phytophthora megakarya]
MKGHDSEKLKQTVQDIRENIVNARSRATYQNSHCCFLPWVVRQKPQLASSLLLEHLEDYFSQLLCSEQRAGHFNLFLIFGHTMSKTLESELTNYFEGSSTRSLQALQNKDTIIKAGKDHLIFDKYSFLCNKMLAHSSKEMPFVHA